MVSPDYGMVLHVEPGVALAAAICSTSLNKYIELSLAMPSHVNYLVRCLFVPYPHPANGFTWNNQESERQKNSRQVVFVAEATTMGSSLRDHLPQILCERYACTKQLECVLLSNV
jgi:hypothetical protein